MTGIVGASGASWTRVGHAGALIDRAWRTRTPLWGFLRFRAYAYTTSDISVKI